MYSMRKNPQNNRQHNHSYARTHTATLEGLFNIYLGFLVEDKNWRLGESQIADVIAIQAVLHKRSLL